ncbi:beta-glucosidase family protein [Nitrospirillum viridazoti]|uniref:Beta-glucosidase n=1 Tax=Nitrospirillum viridazoti CBAmc TaxID=1441467 RepID=A0A248JNG8_9PROT|nr:glycoside hydrolase family 3 C-terminal domain-containing protein [Nitrospirillum amazonense]ASG20282.1 beta-glucosidase [Nitrospirillum amazonense CBAmc]TWB27957.1 beta-glucosidase [Nitrospirillum amazonense]
MSVDLPDDPFAIAPLTSGRDMWSTAELPGIRSIKMADGPMGIASGRVDERDVAVLTPCGTALGASFDPDLVARVGAIVGGEARRLGVDAVLAPNLNLQRSPLCGRAFELFGEDPYLAGALGAAWIGGLQSQGVGSVAKHLVCNDSETDRDSMNAVVDDRALREVYLLPFEMAATAGCVGILAAYNRLNGHYCVEHRQLLTEIVKGDWRYPGFIVSDWFGGRDTVRSALAGLDLDMPGPDRVLGTKFAAAVTAGTVSADRLADAAGRVAGGVRAIDGLPVGTAVADPDAVLTEAAAAGFVLLKNEGGLLPLAPAAVRRLAIIGPNAASPCLQGGTFAKIAVRPDFVTPLQAIRERFGDAMQVVYEQGVAPEYRLPPLSVTPARDLGDGASRGMTVEFFVGDGDGEPVFAETRDTNSLTWFVGLPGTDHLKQAGRIRASGWYVPERGGAHRVHIGGTGTLRLMVDGREVFSGGGPVAPSDLMGTLKGGDSQSVEVDLAAATPVLLSFELAYTPARAQGLWYGMAGPDLPAEMLERALAAAAAADVVLLMVGETADAGVESKDRPGTSLPAAQVDLLHRLQGVNPNIVAICNVAHAFDLSWQDKVKGLMITWYPGEQYGPALAQVLAGDREPGGRLPLSIARQDGDYPAFSLKPDMSGDVPYREGHLIGYKGMQAAGTAPLHAFGAGFGYTRFAVSDPCLTEAADGAAVVSARVRNIGPRPGKAVLQAYVAGPDGIRHLRGFVSIAVPAGEEVPVRLTLPSRAFAHWDTSAGGWRTAPARHEVLLGWSSLDLPLRLIVERAAGR